MAIYRGFRLTKVEWNAHSNRYDAEAEREGGERVEAVGESLYAALAELKLEVERTVPGHETYQGTAPPANTFSQEEIDDFLNGAHSGWPESPYRPAEQLTKEEIEEWLNGSSRGADE
ncbi:MAG: hypothetical protein ACOC7V_10775 [Spirochaetota bacterium]